VAVTVVSCIVAVAAACGGSGGSGDQSDEDAGRPGDATEATPTSAPAETTTSRDPGNCRVAGCNPDVTPAPPPPGPPALALGSPGTFHISADQTMTLTVTSVEVTTCDAPDQVPSRNGFFLAIAARLDVGPGADVGAIPPQYFTIAGNVGPEGALDIMPTVGAAASCSTGSVNYTGGPGWLQASPGGSDEGVFIIDSSTSTGILTYSLGDGRSGGYSGKADWSF
jgi:hypothetical protein